MTRRFALLLARLVAALLVAGVALPGIAAAQARIPVDVVAGKLVVRCDVSTRFRRLPVNLFLDFEATCGLQLHNQAAAGLKAERDDGTAFPITIHLGGVEMTVERRELGDDVWLDDFTRWNSIALGEVAAVGTVGARLLRDYHVVFDLDAGYVELSEPRALEEEPASPPDGSALLPVTIINDIVWLPASYDGGTPGALVLGSSTYDTTVDSFLAADLGHPAGDIGPVPLGDFDVGRFVALRPAEVNYVHPDGALGVIGLNLLHHFRVEVDRVNRSVLLTQTRAAKYPAGDLTFFTAMVDEDAAGVAAFLEEFDDHRLAFEAANLLVTLHLIDGADDAEVRRALEWADRTCPEDLRATGALEQMKTCAAFGFPRHQLVAGEIGIESGRDDRYPNAVHMIHARMGEVLLDLDDEKEAWRHLLSAAFGLPEDGMINLHLGRFYERQERYKRAFSRFVQAAIRPDSGPQAIEGLARVSAKMPEDEVFSVDLVERMIAGKVRNFGAASKFDPDDELTTNRVVLVEFFTNSYLGDGLRGAIGGALANEGLTGHFPPEHVAFLSYHLPDERPDPLINAVGEARAAELRVGRPVVHVVDGIYTTYGAGKYSDAEGIYNAARKLVLDRLAVEADFDLELEGRIEDGIVRGTLVVSGPDWPGLQVRLVLAEKGVLFPGTSEVVVHRMLARASLTGSPDGVAWDPDENGEMRIPFAVALIDVRMANETYLDDYAANGGGLVRKLSLSVDPAQVRLVAYVRDGSDQEILQAVVHDPELPDEAKR